MRLRHDLRHELSIIAARASDLEHACQALPDTEAAMDEALAAMGTEERAQATTYIRLLSQRCVAIRNECQWLIVRLEGKI